jgi:predicted dehydrogenase
MTPPASPEKDIPVMTGCVAEAKGVAISVGYMGRTSVPIEKVKTLLDKAIGRLP